MPNRTIPLAWLYPTASWLIVLATLFVTEYLVMLTLPWLLPHQPSRVVEALVDSVILTAALAPVLWWTVVRPLRDVNRLRAQYLADLFSQIETDRRQAAHELHDGVGQLLTVLISGLRSADCGDDGEAWAGKVKVFRSLAEDALRDVKRLSRGLRPSILDDLGLVPAIERLAEDVRTHHPIELTLDLDPGPGRPLEERTVTALFRIVQEALTNVIQHSGAKHARVTLTHAGDEVTVEVADDGCGIDPNRARTPLPGHLGLAGMRERASLLGGEVAIESEPGRGTRVLVTVPAGGGWL